MCFRSEDREEFRDEILELLGLDHEPHPRNGDNLDTSVPLFMLNLYRNSLHGAQDGLDTSALSPRFRYVEKFLKKTFENIQS